MEVQIQLSLPEETSLFCEQFSSLRTPLGSTFRFITCETGTSIARIDVAIVHFCKPWICWNNTFLYVMIFNFMLYKLLCLVRFRHVKHFVRVRIIRSIRSCLGVKSSSSWWESQLIYCTCNRNNMIWMVQLLMYAWNMQIQCIRGLQKCVMPTFYSVNWAEKWVLGFCNHMFSFVSEIS